MHSFLLIKIPEGFTGFRTGFLTKCLYQNPTLKHSKYVIVSLKTQTHTHLPSSKTRMLQIQVNWNFAFWNRIQCSKVSQKIASSYEAFVIQTLACLTGCNASRGKVETGWILSDVVGPVSTELRMLYLLPFISIMQLICS